MSQDAGALIENGATPEAGAGEGVRRRDFINIAAVSAAGIGGLATLVPLVSQMAPSADVLAQGSTEVDISAVQPGQAIKAVFRKQPPSKVFLLDAAGYHDIWHLTRAGHRLTAEALAGFLAGHRLLDGP